MTTGLRIVEAGWLSTLQDLGRRGVESLGIPVSGAADQYSASAANLLVGNARSATCLEIMAAKFCAVAESDVLISVTGASATVEVDGCRVSMWSPLCVQAGSAITVTDVRDGIRIYIAINGQIGTDLFLGSAAPDPRMGFPQRLVRGDIVDVRTEYDDLVHPYSEIPLLAPDVTIPVRKSDIWTIDVTDGPETQDIPGIRELVESSTYTVGPRSDHVGLRLEGPVAHPENLPEIVSHGIPIGAVEIPHSDELIVLGRARSLTAGYPIVAVATRSSLAILGQSGPGQKLKLRWTTVESAVAAYRAEEAALIELEQTMLSLLGSIGVSNDLGVPA